MLQLLVLVHLKLHKNSHICLFVKYQWGPDNWLHFLDQSTDRVPIPWNQHIQVSFKNQRVAELQLSVIVSNTCVCNIYASWFSFQNGNARKGSGGVKKPGSGGRSGVSLPGIKEAYINAATMYCIPGHFSFVHVLFLSIFP